MGHQDHRASAPSRVACLVVTVSDTRTLETDESGAVVRRLLEGEGHSVPGYHIVKDDPAAVRDLIEKSGARSDVDAVILNGGTGISPRDRTYEAVADLLEKTLDGFGELFRYLSFKEIGSSAMLSRATAGIFRGKVIFSIPGSTPAVRLAMERLILPELGHLVREIRRA